MVTHRGQHGLGKKSPFRDISPEVLKMIAQCVKENQKEQKPRLIKELARNTQIDHRVPVRLLSREWLCLVCTRTLILCLFPVPAVCHIGSVPGECHAEGH